MTNRKFKNLFTLLLSLVILFTNVNLSLAQVSNEKLDEVVNDTAEYMYKTVENPQVGSIGGEWAIIGLARSGYDVPNSYYEKYYNTVEEYVKSRNGNLHNVKYTEYSRVIVALSSIGKDARNVAGYDLTTALGDFDKTLFQGLNGAIWALIALDSRNYPMPENKEAKVQATRDMYINEILERQLNDGGWALFDGRSEKSKATPSDPDITGMTLQALAKYQDKPEVKKAVDEAVECMAKRQNDNGGYKSWGSENSESCVQIIVALTELGISLDDPRFIKNGKGLLDNLLTFHKPGQGFLHVYDGGGSNQMASEQGFYGVVAAKRARDGENSLYRMEDAKTIETKTVKETKKGLPEKNENVKHMPIVKYDITFQDITGVNAHKNQVAIEALAARDIIAGKTKDNFGPNENMTRAEFATIVVKSLGLKLVDESNFKDVNTSDWFSKYVATANKYGIVNGKTKDKFEPNGNITKEEAASMVMRASKLAGMNTELNTGAVRDSLAGFGDYVTVSEWAMPGMAFVYNENILDSSEMKINPKKAITRSEIAQMLFNMLGKANLL